MRHRLISKIGSLLRRPVSPARTERTARPARVGDVTIAYEPCLDGDPDPGEVVWAWVPYEDDPSQGKDRPLVIIGRRGPLLAGVQLTTKHRPGPDQLLVGTGAWDADRRDSWAKLDRIVPLEPDSVRREGAVLDRRRFDELVTALAQRASRPSNRASGRG
jgi:PemK-like, MazF-like toxin of type II toxin-antitoxin system